MLPLAAFSLHSGDIASRDGDVLDDRLVSCACSRRRMRSKLYLDIGGRGQRAVKGRAVSWCVAHVLPVYFLSTDTVHLSDSHTVESSSRA
jgi:hypothetical protein